MNCVILCSIGTFFAKSYNYLNAFYDEKIGLTAMASEVDQTVEAEAQVEQTINVEATGFQVDKPQLNITFTYCGVPQKFMVQLPVFLHKFLEGTIM